MPQGVSAAAVALRLGVSRQSAHRWRNAWQTGGIQALRARGPIGRHRKLSAVQLGRVEQALLQGAGAHGFASNLWTLDRVTEVIWRLTGVHHHPVQVWRILTQLLGWSLTQLLGWSLTQLLGWSLQRPRRTAAERNQAAIDRWLAVEWPRIKGGRAAGARGSSSWTRAASP
jgi:transposase